MPAVPMTLITRHSRRRVASSKTSRKRSSSRSRPTMGASSRRAKAGAPERTPSRRHARTGCDFPFNSSGSRGSTSTRRAPDGGCLADQDLPGLAAASRR